MAFDWCLQFLGVSIDCCRTADALLMFLFDGILMFFMSVDGHLRDFMRQMLYLSRFLFYVAMRVNTRKYA